ncbi:TetR/AcrR family transcriptional regulator [uncultured Williamsia sp.]|uniref:TetR/AcrR family transcriptional regulator n=1 Tax=uncultured Williamsia sp. TaxID=259311 RepID=UPI0026146412|nr:TetR/AcrR family transcriptional regulator [uncultured Williamsia sp.]
MTAQSPLPAGRNGTRGRPRDAAIDDAVLQATRDLLVEEGYGAVTMNAVARRAGTTKTALYRRWASKTELLHEAVLPSGVEGIAALDADPRTAVEQMLRWTRDRFTEPAMRAALPGIIVDLRTDPALAGRVLERFAPTFAVLDAHLADARRRGSITTAADPMTVSQVIGGAVIVALLIDPYARLDDDWLRRTADLLGSGISR